MKISAAQKIAHVTCLGSASCWHQIWRRSESEHVFFFHSFIKLWPLHRSAGHITNIAHDMRGLAATLLFHVTCDMPHTTCETCNMKLVTCYICGDICGICDMWAGPTYGNRGAVRAAQLFRMAFVSRSKNVLPTMTPLGGEPLAMAYVWLLSNQIYAQIQCVCVCVGVNVWMMQHVSYRDEECATHIYPRN